MSKIGAGEEGRKEAGPGRGPSVSAGPEWLVSQGVVSGPAEQLWFGGGGTFPRGAPSLLSLGHF